MRHGSTVLPYLGGKDAGLRRPDTAGLSEAHWRDVDWMCGVGGRVGGRVPYGGRWWWRRMVMMMVWISVHGGRSTGPPYHEYMTCTVHYDWALWVRGAAVPFYRICGVTLWGGWTWQGGRRRPGGTWIECVGC